MRTVDLVRVLDRRSVPTSRHELGGHVQTRSDAYERERRRFGWRIEGEARERAHPR